MFWQLGVKIRRVNEHHHHDEARVIDEDICRRWRQLLHWDASGRRRNHSYQINCWTIDAFHSEYSHKKHPEKETAALRSAGWHFRRTWERKRSI